jgi:TRAP-type C4-dicarboxylate transport system permease small subunit
MKRAMVVIWAFCFIALVFLGVLVVHSNWEELTHSFNWRISFPYFGAYQIKAAFNVGTYMALCILLGGAAVALMTLATVVRATLETRKAHRELDDCRAELARLRGPAEDDIVYRPAPTGDQKG